MKLQTIEQARKLATVLPGDTVSAMSSSEKLLRWADCLKAHGSGRLRLLHGTEYTPDYRRAGLREDDSLLSLAYRDPLLRTLGLVGDTYEDARRFFGLSHAALHKVVCSCHYAGIAARPRDIAARIRRLARRVQRAERFVGAIGLGGTRPGAVLTRMLI